jgi:hypothetical protein
MRKKPCATKEHGWTAHGRVCKLLTAPVPRRLLPMRLTGFIALAGAFRVAFASPVWAAETPVSAENIVVDRSLFVYRVPHLDAYGTQLTGAELAGMFDSKSPGTLDERLARLTAARIVIPEMIVESKPAAAGKQRIVYHDMTLEDVVGGRVGTSRTASIDQAVDPAKGGHYDAHWGRAVDKGLDLRQIAHVTSLTRSDEKEALKPIDDETVIEDVVMSSPDSKFELRFGRTTASGVKARAFAELPSQIMEKLGAPDAKPVAEDPEPLLRIALDVVGSFDLGGWEARDITLSGKASPGDKSYSVKLARAALTKLESGVVGEMTFDDLALVSADGGSISLKRATLRGLDLRAALEGKAKRFPRLAHFDFAGLNVDLPDAKTSETARVKLKLGAYSSDFANFLDGVPTKASSVVQHLIIDLTTQAQTPSIVQALDLGYRELDLSTTINAEWREKTQELAFEPVRIEARDMALATLAATLGDVSSNVFSENSIVSRASMLGASARQVDFKLENPGVVDRLIAQEAKKRGVAASIVRLDYAKSASTAVLTILGDSEKSRRISAAIDKFIAAPKRLHIRLSAPKGVGVLDTTGKPADILQAIDVEATAN